MSKPAWGAQAPTSAVLRMRLLGLRMTRAPIHQGEPRVVTTRQDLRVVRRGLIGVPMLEGEARRPDAVEPALEHGRHGEPPGGKDQHQAIGGGEPGLVVENVGAGHWRTVVVGALLGGEGRGKAFSVEIEQIDGHAACFERGDGHASKARAETVGEWMGEDDEGAHDGSDGFVLRSHGRGRLVQPRLWIR